MSSQGKMPWCSSRGFVPWSYNRCDWGVSDPRLGEGLFECVRNDGNGSSGGHFGSCFLGVIYKPEGDSSSKPLQVGGGKHAMGLGY